MTTLTLEQATQLADREAENRKWVRYWLYFICAMVAAMVIVGGATRLTDSGLSITEWKPLLGAIPPLNAADWLSEFEKYKQIPQYLEINKGMSLEEFKFIYWWEWGHRFLGRWVGVFFAVPLAFFWLTGRLESGLKPRVLFLLFLGGLQGFIGWWMVSSGLVERTDVSQYRLAVHLTLACIVFFYALWIARGLAPHSEEPATNSLRGLAPLIVIFTLFQIFLGGLVAGLDAGLSFNDWPLMDGSVVPSGLLVMDPFWLNFFENNKTVQFVHRMSGYVLTGLVIYNLILAQKSGNGQSHVWRSIILVVLILTQLALGVLTLIFQVPMDLALFHQAGALVVLAFATAHWRALRGAYAPVTFIATTDGPK